MISLVIPVYNSESTLTALVGRVDGVMNGIGADYEIVLVNDASRDGSWSVIQGLAEGNPRVRGVDLTRNFGQHNALLCGIRSARGELIVTMDDDLQNPPEEIPRLMAALEESVDVVYGTPQRQQHGFWRDLASRVTKLVLQNAMGSETAGKVSAFRLFRTQLRDAFEAYQSPFVSIDVLLTWATSSFVAIPVEHAPREAGRSNYTVRSLLRHAANMMTGFSTIPLQLASLMGFLLTFFGIGVLAWVVGRYLVDGSTVPGFPFLASIIAIFSGAQLFALGIIGEYLARIHFRTMDQPPYVVRERISGPVEP